MRTLGMQRRLAEKFRQAKGIQADAIHFYSTSRPPLLPGPDSKLMIDLLIPPEMHLMTGTVNNTLASIDKEWLPKNSLDNWISDVKLERGQFGLNGNSARDLLNKHLSDLEDSVPLSCLKYVRILQALKEVKDACFSKELLPWYRQSIAKFKGAFEKNNIKVYPKAHIIIDHVGDFCEKERQGLGLFSEQSFESFHRNF